MPTREQVFDALRAVRGPGTREWTSSNSGLLYDAEIDNSHVKVTYSLTSMGCPVGPLIEQQIVETVKAMDGVEDVVPDLTWDPPWSPERMSEDAKFILGFGY